MNRITREEIAVIAFFALFFIGLGAVCGWSVRVVSSNDRFLVSTAVKHFTEAELSQKQIDQIIKEGSKDLQNTQRTGIKEKR